MRRAVNDREKVQSQGDVKANGVCIVREEFYSSTRLLYGFYEDSKGCVFQDSIGFGTGSIQDL